MEKGTCYIVGAGECYELDFSPASNDYVIAADGGFAHLRRNGIKVDMVIGDLDSLTEPFSHPNLVALCKEKDDTDTFAAVREGISRGYKNFRIYCCTGGRLEHTVANMQLLAYLAKNQIRGYLFDRDCVITAVTDGQLRFSSEYQGYISVFSHSDESSGVFLKGLKYELDNVTLANTFPLGVSNEFTGVESIVKVTEGTLLVIYPREERNRKSNRRGV